MAKQLLVGAQAMAAWPTEVLVTRQKTSLV